VRVTTNTTASNLLGSVFGDATSVVTKTAIAAFSTLGGGTPNLPLALCDCAFQSGCFDNTCEPSITYPSPAQNAAWTGFTANSDQSIRSFLPAACDNKGGSTPPDLTAGSSTVDVTNGTGSPPFDGVHCMACTLGMCTTASPCLVPVMRCSSCPAGSLNGNQSVVGFAELVISSFNYSNGGNCNCSQSCNGNINGINFQSVFKANVTGPPSGGGCVNNSTCDFGVGFVQLVG
jgi:hypothetical protein